MSTRTMTPGSFKEIHNAFVTTEEGISLSELLQVLGSLSITPIIIPLLIPWVVPPSFAKQAVHDKDFFFLIKAIVEYPVLAVFPIWAVTFFAGQTDDDQKNMITTSGVVFVTLLCTTIGILILNYSITSPKWLGIRQHWEKIRSLPTGWTAANETKGRNRTGDNTNSRLPFITTYRAITIYITVVSILAVDFTVFPRRFAKTKAYGISLMDIGTGCFVFANGIVSPEARSTHLSLIKSIKSSVPIFVLGFIRLVTVKGIEYQEVVEEYGVHWNFFFTLGGVKILSSFLFQFCNSMQGLKIASVLCLCYELLLNYNDLQNVYILNSNIPRNGLLNSNREGLLSVLGYLSIYMASVYFGRLITIKKRTSIYEWSEYALKTFLQIIVLWTAYALSTNYGSRPCRRTANLTYVLLMVALNYSLLWFEMALALVQVCLQHVGLIYGPIIFYELAEFQQREAARIKNLKQMPNAVEGRRKSNVQNSMDNKLQILDEQLEETLLKVQNQPNSNFDRAMLAKIISIEKEVEDLERHIVNDDSTHEDESVNNFVLMPDLSKAPVILEAICYNGLAVFLLGNLLTGLINSLIYTMYTPPYIALCYLWFYGTVITAFSVTLYWYEIKLKVW